MRTEEEAETLLGLLRQHVPEMPAVKVTVDFSNQKGWAIRVHPRGQSVSYLYYHNGREWHMLREDGNTHGSEIGWSPNEFDMALVSIILLSGQLASGFASTRAFSNLSEEADFQEEAYTYCLNALTRMASNRQLRRPCRKWAAEAAQVLSSL